MSSGDVAIPNVEGFTDFQVVGHGGFSIVYSATQTDFRRRVAVKVLNVDPAAVNRLRRETHASERSTTSRTSCRHTSC